MLYTRIKKWFFHSYGWLTEREMDKIRKENNGKLTEIVEAYLMETCNNESLATNFDECICETYTIKALNLYHVRFAVMKEGKGYQLVSKNVEEYCFYSPNKAVLKNEMQAYFKKYQEKNEDENCRLTITKSL